MCWWWNIWIIIIKMHYVADLSSISVIYSIRHNAVFFTRMPNGFSPCQERDEARHQPAVFRGLWSQKVDSAGESGKVRRWKHFLTCSAVRSLNSPGLQTSALCFHLDQRAQPQFEACKHGETSAPESTIFPLRIFQVDVLKQTLPCFWPHL